MKLRKILIPEEKLESMPENEKIFFVQTGNLLNDLHMLQKLALFSINKPTKAGVEHTAQGTLSMFIVNNLASTLWEGWQMLQKNFFGTKSLMGYDKLLDDAGKENLDKLKKYFNSKGHTFKKIRDEFAYHYDRGAIKQHINATDENGFFELYFSEGNYLFCMSNPLVGAAIADSTNVSDINKALDILYSDVFTISKSFQMFLNHCLVVIAKKYLGAEHEEIEITDPPDIGSVFIPYFVKKS